MKDKTFNTLFMLSSIDGKISTGSTDKRDVDKDFPKIKGIKEGLQQYYNLEKLTDIHSFNTGKVMAKVGMNKKQKNIIKIPANFIIVDNKPHLTKIGVENLLKRTQKLYLVTTNKKHPAYKVKSQDLKIIHYKNKINFINLFKKLKQKYNIPKVTIQSGGNMNALLIRKNLIDRLSLVIAPTLIGGKQTSTLVDGASLKSLKDLKHIKSLKLTKVAKLKNSYLHLVYSLRS